jgi:crossover junction endodeoxyribonuclease RusA
VIDLDPTALDTAAQGLAAWLDDDWHTYSGADRDNAREAARIILSSYLGAAQPDPGWPLDVFVPGKPAPQGSMRAIVHKHSGRAVAIKDNNDRQKSWRADVRDAVLNVWDQSPIDGPVQVAYDFVMPRPVSTPKRSTPAAIKKPDWDKLSRAISDALTSAGAYTDDSRTVDAHITKRIAEIGETPGARIRVRPTSAVAAPAVAPVEMSHLSSVQP